MQYSKQEKKNAEIKAGPVNNRQSYDACRETLPRQALPPPTMFGEAVALVTPRLHISSPAHRTQQPIKHFTREDN